MLFSNRTEAGRELAVKLADYADRPDAIVLALPRGGVPVAFEAARALHLSWDIFLVRKLGLPGREELAMGAIASGDIIALNNEVVTELGVPSEVIRRVAADEREELRRREQAYRGDRPPLDVRGRTVILIDDGLATGSSMRAAIAALRLQRPARIVVATPVGAAETCAELGVEADEVICARMPEPFLGVGRWYADFAQVSDDEVRTLLAQARSEPASGAGRSTSSAGE